MSTFYTAVISITHPRKRKKSYLLNHLLKLKDPDNPKFWLRLKFSIPMPEKVTDEPVILVCIDMQGKGIFLKFRDLDLLEKIFNLDGISELAQCNLKEDLKEGLEKALKIKAVREAQENQIRECLCTLKH